MEDNQNNFVLVEKEYIRRLIMEKKYALAQLIVDSFLIMFPDDIEMNRYKAEILLKNGEYDKAIDVFKYLTNKYGFGYFELFKCYHLNGNYDEAYKMIPTIEKISPSFDLRLFKVLYEYKLNINNGRLPITYLDMQICSYNENKALLHIGFHEDEIEGKEIHTIFHEQINTKTLYYEIQKRLLLGNVIKNNRFDICDEYYFKFPNVGTYNGEVLNYLKVVTVSGTNNIITMYPVVEPMNGIINDYFETQKRINKNEKIELSMSIKDSIYKHNYELAYKKIQKYISKYGDDIYISVLKTRALIGLERYNEAIDYAERNIQINDNLDTIKELLWYLYNYTKRYEEAAMIFCNFLKKNFHDADACLAFYKKLDILNPKTKVFKEETEKTMLNYDKQYFIDIINKQFINNGNYIYTQLISLEELFNRIECSIMKSKRTLVLTDIYDKYCFSIDGLFTDKNGNQIHYIIVKVVPNTTDIISIIPLESCGNYYVNSLDIPVVSKKSDQIDKFYARMRKK